MKKLTNFCLDQFGISQACDGTLNLKFFIIFTHDRLRLNIFLEVEFFNGIARECCLVKNLKPLRKTVNLLGRNSARRASELRKHTGRASFSYTNFVLQTHGIQEEMWKEIQAFWREKKVYDKFTQLRRKHFRHSLSYLINR